MGNSTFGVDPDPGQVKALRIYARGPDGRERMFEYREGSTVDGSQFSSWGSGDWGNERWSGRWEGREREREACDKTVGRLCLSELSSEPILQHHSTHHEF